MTQVSSEEWYRLRFPEKTEEVESLTLKELQAQHFSLLGKLAASDAKQVERLQTALRENPGLLMFVDD